MGKVKYFSRKKIESDLKNCSQIKLVDVIDFMLKSLFVKRDSFKHESEYRLICMCEMTSPHYGNTVIPLRVDPCEFIERIYFDPRANHTYVERCKKVLTKAFSFPVDKIHKSTLYEFNSIRIDVI